MVGYGVTSRQANNTHARYSVTDDPEDPLFYSTCYIKRPQWKFLLQLVVSANVTVTIVPPPWAFSDRCVECHEWKAAQDPDSSVPVWHLPTSCRNCEVETLPPVPSLITNIVSRGQKCDGSWGSQTVWNYPAPNDQCKTARCVKTLTLVGSNAMSAAECIAKAKLEPECGEHVQHRPFVQNVNAVCECWVKTNDACCGTCKPVDYAFSNWRYSVYSVVNPIGDPLCSAGVKSADGAYCCPTKCGTCLSRPVFEVSFQPSTMIAPPGMAVDSGSLFSTKAQLTYPQPLSSDYGWNCDLTSMAEDRDSSDGLNYRSTYVKPDFTTCGSVVPEWSVNVGSNGTLFNYEVHTLHSTRFTSVRGCKLNGRPNFDDFHPDIRDNDMAWVVRAGNSTTGKITWSGATNSNCGGISALRIYPQMGLPAVDCQTLSGMCCPQFLEMASRPCSSFPAPCSLI